MTDIPKIGITGLPNVGKTATLLKIVEKLERDGFTVGGMMTTSVMEGGRRVGFKLRDWRTKEEVLFAHRSFDTKHKVEMDDGIFCVDVPKLEGVGLAAVKKATTDPEVDLVIIDEVGKMETHSDPFAQAVKDALDSDKPVIMTLHKKSRNPLLQDIRRRDDVRILEVTPVNKNLLPYKIEKLLQEKLEGGASFGGYF